MDVYLTIHKHEVINEVERTVEYTADKFAGDDTAYERIQLLDGNKEGLDRFWDECRSEVASTLYCILKNEGMADDGDTYEVILNVSKNFNSALLMSINKALMSFFVERIVAKWFIYCNKADYETHFVLGTQMLTSVLNNALYPGRPKNPNSKSDTSTLSIIGEAVINVAEIA